MPAVTSAPDPARAARPAGADARSELVALLESARVSWSQRRVAQFLTDHADEVVYLTAAELASRIGVSQPTVTRFAAALGFRGYAELRDRMRAILAAAPPDAAFGRVPAQNRFQAAVAREAEQLAALAASLADDAELARVGEALAASSPLVVLGARSSNAVAHAFALFAQKVHPDVRLLLDGGSTNGDTLLHARGDGEQWLLAFALPLYPRELRAMLELARSAGYRTATVTDRRSSPAAALSDATLVAPVTRDLVFDSQAAPLALSTCLLEAMCEALPGASARLEAIERTARERELFWDDDTHERNRG